MVVSFCVCWGAGYWCRLRLPNECGRAGCHLGRIPGQDRWVGCDESTGEFDSVSVRS